MIVSFTCWVQTLYQTYSLQVYLFLLCGFSIHFLTGILWNMKAFNFDESQFLCFFLLARPLSPPWAGARGRGGESLPNAMLWKFTSVFSLKSFMILTFTFRSLNHIKIISYVVRGFQIHSFECRKWWANSLLFELPWYPCRKSFHYWF